MITTCAALAEKLFGIGKAEQDFLLLAVSNGIGSGFVCGGEVFHSHRGFETELGHVSINCKDCSVPAETEAVWKCMRAVMWSEKN